MAKPVEIKALITGGKATAGPPIGPALGPLKLNVKEVVNKINEKTKDYKGMTVPIVLTVDPETKEYTITVSTPQTSVLLKKEANVDKGSGAAGTEIVGNVDMDAVVKIAKMKQDVLLAQNLKTAIKEVVGTALSCGITVDNKSPKEIQKEIDKGTYDSLLK